MNRETVIAEALDLLDEVGLEGISTRQLAKRLGVEQPSLYWHFRKKEELLAPMAETAMVPTRPLRFQHHPMTGGIGSSTTRAVSGERC